jgi:formate dehydrogenase subunit delta
MDIDNLVRMANQIGGFFSAYPDRDEALEGIATHIKKFWEPRMRIRLIDALDTQQTQELLPLVKEALSTHQASLRPVVI